MAGHGQADALNSTDSTVTFVLKSDIGSWGLCHFVRTMLLCLVQRLVGLAELREDVLQQLQSIEARKMAMAEQKLAEQVRLAADLDVRLQAACGPLDCAAGQSCCFNHLGPAGLVRLGCAGWAGLGWAGWAVLGGLGWAGNGLIRRAGLGGVGRF